MKPLKVFGIDYKTPDGSAIRDYIHVSDLAIGHLKSIEYLSENESTYRVFNLGLGKGISVLEILNTYQAVNNIKINYIIKFCYNRIYMY